MRFAVVTSCLILMTSALSFAQGGSGSFAMNTYADTLGYLTGMQLYKGFERDNVKCNVALVSAGIRDAMNGGKQLLNQKQRADVLVGVQSRSMEARKRVAEGGETDTAKLNRFVFGSVSPNSTGQISSQNDSISYSIGFNIGEDIEKNGVGVSPEGIGAALADMRMQKAPRLTEDDILKINFRMQQEMRMMAEERLRAGQEFLAENQQKDGVIVLPNGLQYEVIKKGTGPKPTKQDKVTVHYTGTFIDGTVFDSSIDKGEPVTFPLTGVIDGWTEALKLMPVGSKWKVYIPADLAYGEKGFGGRIGPNEALIFEIELLSIAE